jgi:glycosyltransferase involved in cell wall biosynthesis
MSVLRVLHVAPYAPEAWAYGGIPRVAGALTRGLARRGLEVTLCTTDACDEGSRLRQYGPSPVVSEAQPRKCTLEGPSVRVFPNLSNHLAYHFQAFLPVGFDRFMRQHARRFDVAHLHACRNLPGVIAARHLRRHNIPYVLAPNGTAPNIERRRSAKRVFDVLMGQQVLDGAARVLAVTRSEARDLTAMGVGDETIKVIPNPVDLDEFQTPGDSQRFRQRFAIPAGPLVLFLGKITPRKGVDVLARAFAALAPRSDATLVIAGNDTGGGAAARAILAAAGLSGRAAFTGLLAGHDRLDALSAADVVVYPSEREVFGLVPLEALLCGTPVIVSSDSGCGEVIAHTGGGQIVPFGDATALARAIESTLAAMPAWRNAARVAAITVRSTYDGDVVCEQIERMYLGMVA